MSSQELRIFQGGLMRCCIETLYEKHDAGEFGDGSVVEKIECKWCRNGMVQNDSGVWEWEGAKSLAHYRDDGK